MSSCYYDVTVDWGFEGSVDGLDIGNTEATKLVLRDGRVIGTKLGAIDGLPLGTYDGFYLGSSECSTNGTKDDKVDGLLLGV